MLNIARKFGAMMGREEGSVATLAGVTITLLVPAVIAAVDITNITATKEDVQSRLDSAVLAASRFSDLEEANRDGSLQRLGERFLNNSLQGKGLDTESFDMAFEFDEAQNVVRANVSFKAPTLFVGKAFDIDTLNLVSETKPREPIELEVALSLDVSGSMGWAVASNNPAPAGQRRIDILAEGVESLIDVFDDNPLVNARIAMIPYSTSVNLETVKVDGIDTDTGNDLPNTPATGGTGGGDDGATWAVENVERNGAGQMKIEDDVKSDIRKTVSEGADIRDDDDDDDKKKEKMEQERMQEDVKPVKTAPIGLPKAAVQPLSDPEEIAAYVKGIVPEGATAGHIGAEWALYSLMPDWQGTWNHEQPPSEFDGEARKIMVMMTDGDFTVTHTPGMSIEDAYDVFQDVCATARDAGIVVYTVGLRSSAKTDAELSACAGADDRYFPVDGRSELVKAFEEIAEDATRLRVSG